MSFLFGRCLRTSGYVQKHITWIIGSCLGIALVATAQEDFVGPFASWTNVKTVYGAKGDGKADDYAAIQKGLDELGMQGHGKVLYFPAGTYSITATLQQKSQMYSVIVGEGPDKTTIKWAGPADSIMLWCNGTTRSTWSRLCWDGSGKAGIGIAHKWDVDHTPLYVTTAILHEDEIFYDMKKGLEGGGFRGWNDAEVTIKRCKFYRCTEAAVSVESFNALDWWIWDSYFEDCYLGVTNEYGSGNFQIYRSVFKRSKKSDISIRHTTFFTFLENYSEGSKAFLLAQRALNWKPTETWGSAMTVQGNTIVNSDDTSCIRLQNNGNFLFLDNTFISKSTISKGPVITLTCPDTGDFMAIGNTFTVADQFDVKGRIVAFDNPVVDRSSLHPSEPQLPVCPPKAVRPILEVPNKANADAIQVVVNKAVAMKGKRPIVHFVDGTYEINKTIVVPANCDMQLRGDAAFGAQLKWTGREGLPVLLLKGPSHAEIFQLMIDAGNESQAIVIDNADQSGGMIAAENVIFSTTLSNSENIGGSELVSTNFSQIIYGLDTTYVQMSNFDHRGLRVIGGPVSAAGKMAPGKVNCFMGCGCRNFIENGAKLVVRDTWYEGMSVPVQYYDGSGEFTYVGGMNAPGHQTIVEFNKFNGKAIIGQFAFAMPQIKLRANGEAKNGKVLLFGVSSNSAKGLSVEGDKLQVGMINSACSRTDGTGFDRLADNGLADENYLRDMLRQLRQEKPRYWKPGNTVGVTNVALHRLECNGKWAVLITAGSSDGVLKTPTQLTVQSIGPLAARLEWKSNGKNEYGFVIERKSGTTGKWEKINMAGAAQSTYIDEKKVPGTHYSYRVRAFNSATQSSWSNEASVTMPQPDPAGIKVNCVGPDVGAFKQDVYLVKENIGHWPIQTTHAIDRSGVTNPAPEQVYQTLAYNDFTYEVPGLVPDGKYKARLHMAEIIDSAKVGQRKFSLSINNQTVLKDFDVLAETVKYKALVKEFVILADTNGIVQIEATGLANLSAFELIPEMK